MPPRAGVGPCKAGKVTGRCFGPALAVGVAAVHVDKQASEGADVLVVVPNDFQQRGRLAEPQELEVPRRDLPAADVGMPTQPEEHRLHRPEAGIGHPVPEHPAHERQQVEVTGMDRRTLAGKAVARDEERPVEAAAVVGD